MARGLGRLRLHQGLAFAVMLSLAGAILWMICPCARMVAQVVLTQVVLTQVMLENA